jgi:uncharacterized protein YicC (UPF0701 family)
MKAMVQKYISRGKVDVYVTIDATKSDDVTISVNEHCQRPTLRRSGSSPRNTG